MQKQTRNRKTTAWLAGVLALTMTVWADWPNNNPTKWVQLPDLLQGVNINATQPLILADDFKCTFTGPITDIHIWGSWLYDVVDPMAVFRLSIHPNIPAGPGGWSVPGPALWSIILPPTGVRLWATANEGFFDPRTMSYLGVDTQVWLYNFILPPDMAFVQQEGDIYWLNVSASCRRKRPLARCSVGRPPTNRGWTRRCGGWTEHRRRMAKCSSGTWRLPLPPFPNRAPWRCWAWVGDYYYWCCCVAPDSGSNRVRSSGSKSARRARAGARRAFSPHGFEAASEARRRGALHFAARDRLARAGKPTLPALEASPGSKLPVCSPAFSCCW